jgi:hypothetical protein
MATTKSRGSDLLKQRWTEKDLMALANIKSEGTELLEFFPKGIPAPDGGWGVWRVTPQTLSDLIQQILKNRVVPGIHIFPKGIPVPDWFEVVFEAGSARVR